MSDAPRASILVLNRGDLDLLGRCLDAIRRNVGDEVAYEVVVFLNGVEQDVAALGAERFVDVHMQRSGINLGYPAGNNRAAARARGEFLVLLNDDTEVQPGWLESLVAAADEHPEAGAIGSRQLSPDGSLQEAGGVVWSDGSTAQVGRGVASANARFLHLRRVDYCSGASLLVRRSTWDSVGGFDEEFFPGYYEDVDLAFAIRQRGQHVLYEPAARIVHHEAGLPDIGFRSFVATRNLKRLRSKWSAALSTHVDPGPYSPARLDWAILRAEDWPRRLLVIGERPPEAELIQELRSIPAATTVLAQHGLGDGAESLCRFGCDIIQDDLTAHLSAPETMYDTVILHGPRDAGSVIAAVRRHQPAAGLVHDTSVEPGCWSEALAQAKTARVDEYVH